MWPRVVALLILSLGTAIFSIAYDRHDIIDDNLLVNPRFHEDFSGWQVHNSDAVSAQAGVLTLANPDRHNRSSISVRQTVAVPQGQRLLFLSCEARATEVIPGEKRWHTARVVIVPLTPAGEPRHDVPHTLAWLDGTTSWASFGKVFRVPEENAAVSVVVQLLNARGTLEVRAIALRPAIEDPAYTQWRHVLMLAWLMAGLWIVWPLLRGARHDVGRTGILLIGSIILVGILMPASVKEAMTPSWLLPEREAQGPYRADLRVAEPFRYELLPIELNIHKLAHFALFAAIGYLLIARRPYRIPIGAQIGIVGLFALATEAMQVLASGRDGSLNDVLIDLFGACCGLLAAAAVQRHGRQK